MKSDFLIAITQLAAERGLPRDIVITAVEAALISAFKKDHLAEKDLAVRFAQSGDVHVFARWTVVPDEEFEDPETQIALADAKSRGAAPEVGAVIEEEVTPANAGRIAAQTAKQVVMQRLREAERDIVFEEYSGREQDIVAAVVQRMDGRAIIFDLGRAEAIMPFPEQIPNERYRNGQRFKVYILEVGKTAKGPQIVVSRADRGLLRRLFELEVPEIYNGIVEIKAIAREPGYRSKVAVHALQERVDPVGSCVGLRGVRIQNIVNELHGERIDVIEWSPDPGAFISRALGPAQVMNVVITQENTAVVVVPDRQLALAIGREGQNARLAAKLTGWRIDIKSVSEAEADRSLLTPHAPVRPPAEIKEREAAQAAPAPAATPEPSPAAEVPAEPGAAELEPAVAEHEIEIEPAPAVDLEPQPVLAQGESEPAQQETTPEEEDAPTLAEALKSEETWKLPTQQTPQAVAAAAAANKRSSIRFAEDIWEERGAEGPGGERRRGGGGRGRGRRGRR